jgi:DNA-directed RNA polymerase subunit RPC12/RpoP
MDFAHFYGVVACPQCGHSEFWLKDKDTKATCMRCGQQFEVIAGELERVEENAN